MKTRNSILFLGLCSFFLLSMGLISTVPYADAVRYGLYDGYYIKFSKIDSSYSYEVYEQATMRNTENYLTLLGDIFNQYNNIELEFSGVTNNGAFVTYTDHTTGKVRYNDFTTYNEMRNDFLFPQVVSIDSTWGDQVWAPVGYSGESGPLDYDGIQDGHMRFVVSSSGYDASGSGSQEWVLWYDAGTGFFTGFNWSVDVYFEGQYIQAHYNVVSYESGGKPPVDSDGDGITDDIDACPNAAETYNGYQDGDGCPDTKPAVDSDGDGIVDSIDACPNAAENYNGYQDGDGCPDTKPVTSQIPTVPPPSGNVCSDPNYPYLWSDGNCYDRSEGSSGCLIATATYGSELAPQVQQLREIRDDTLLQTSSGAAFMTGFNAIYYSFAPTISDWERENPVFKEAVKITITPLLSSLSILNYVEMDSEASVLGYGIGVILLNVGMYFVAPAMIILQIRKKFS